MISFISNSIKKLIHCDYLWSWQLGEWATCQNASMDTVIILFYFLYYNQNIIIYIAVLA